MTREYINGDCMEGMKAFPDNHFDLAIVDPPYGIGYSGRDGMTTAKFCNSKKWDESPPTKEYFTELFRVSKNQIIWGGNYFTLNPTKGIICWFKHQNGHYSEWEFAWSSKGKAKHFDRPYQKDIFNKIHPTQKPVALYRWLLDNYAKPGDLLLDTHVGSASSLIAFEEKGFEYVAFELDKDYYRDSCKRLETFRSQLRLFDTPIEKKEYKQLSITE